jgi:hypothetical protein
MDQGAVCQVSFAFGAFFGQNVTFKSMLPLQFTGTGYLKPFLCTGIRLHFWHLS